MRPDLRRHVVAYDIPDDRRRQRIAKTLTSYGDRVQFSVFIVDAAPVKLARLRRSLVKLMEPSEDSVLICDLGPLGSVEEGRYICLGRQRRITGNSSFVI